MTSTGPSEETVRKAWPLVEAERAEVEIADGIWLAEDGGWELQVRRDVHVSIRLSDDALRRLGDAIAEKFALRARLAIEFGIRLDDNPVPP